MVLSARLRRRGRRPLGCGPRVEELRGGACARARSRAGSRRRRAGPCAACSASGTAPVGRRSSPRWTKGQTWWPASTPVTARWPTPSCRWPAEAEAYRALADTGVRIPRLHAVAPDGLALLADRAPGTHELQDLSDDAAPSDRRRLPRRAGRPARRRRRRPGPAELPAPDRWPEPRHERARPVGRHPPRPHGSAVAAGPVRPLGPAPCRPGGRQPDGAVPRRRRTRGTTCTSADG